MPSKHMRKKKSRVSLSAFGLITQIPVNVEREIAAVERPQVLSEPFPPHVNPKRDLYDQAVFLRCECQGGDCVIILWLLHAVNFLTWQRGDKAAWLTRGEPALRLQKKEKSDLQAGFFSLLFDNRSWIYRICALMITREPVCALKRVFCAGINDNDRLWLWNIQWTLIKAVPIKTQEKK